MNYQKEGFQKHRSSERGTPGDWRRLLTRGYGTRQKRLVELNNKTNEEAMYQVV